jgi:hypothetical protein
MAMGLQNTEDETCYAEIHILDLTPLDLGEQPTNVTTINSVIVRAGETTPTAVNGVAMTKEHGADGKYIVAGVQGNVLTIYKSFNTVLDPSKDDQFYVLGESIAFPRSGPGIALITQTDGSIFIVALDTDDDYGSNNRAYLYQLTISDSSVVLSEEFSSVHLIVPGMAEGISYALEADTLAAIAIQDETCGLFLSGFGLKGEQILNTSFRWGKGLEILSPDDINVYATDRNDLTISKFSKPVDTEQDFSLVTWTTVGNGGDLPILGSKLAVITFEGPQLRLYFQTNAWLMQEYSYTGDSWVWGDPLPEAYTGSSVAAVTWEGDVQHMRLYFQTPDGAIQEYSNDGEGWGPGETLPVADAGSAIAAITWRDDNGVHLRVYYELQGLVQESCYDGFDENGWNANGAIPVLANGSDIAAIGWQDASGVHLRLYIEVEGSIQEYCYDGNGWTTGAILPGTADVGTGIGAVVWQDSSGVHFRVYFASNGTIQEACYDGNGWTAGATLPGTPDDQTPISAVYWEDAAGVHLRVYFQENWTIQESGYDGYGNGWNTSILLPMVK